MDNVEIIAIFRTIAPEFAEVEDAAVLLQIEFCKDFVSESKFGKFYGKAIAYYAAHMMKIYNVAEENGSESGMLTAGGVVMEKEGDLQRQYAQAESSQSIDDMMKKTMYGKMFLQIRSMCIVPALTRMG